MALNHSIQIARGSRAPVTSDGLLDGELYYDKSNNSLYIGNSNTLINLQGSIGVGISSIENNGYTQDENFTTSHIKAILTNGTEENFDIQAKNGSDATVTSKYIHNICITLQATGVTNAGNISFNIISSANSAYDNIYSINGSLYSYAGFNSIVAGGVFSLVEDQNNIALQVHSNGPNNTSIYVVGMTFKGSGEKSIFNSTIGASNIYNIQDNVYQIV